MNPANETERSADRYLFAAGTYKLLAVAIGTIGVFGFCNNVAVILLYCRFKRLRTPTNLLLVNISLSDFLVSVIGINFTFASCVKGRWIWSQATCVWDGFSNSLFGIVSIMTLAALAYERYIRVVHAQVVDFPWAWRVIAHIWLYSLAWTGAPLLGWNRYTLEIHQLGCSLDWASKDPNDASFILFFLFACFFVPVGIMVYCYGNILYTVRMVRLRTMFLLFYKNAHLLLCWDKFSLQFRRYFLQLLCSRLFHKISWLQQNLKERPLTPAERPVRPIVVSSACDSRDRPKKRVTFNSSSIVFIITSDNFQQFDVTSKAGDSSQVNVVQVRPL
uniref:Opsin 3 n=1 Tax=Xiphophorus couchianus TaxID=32473 RepID=A0A3B5LE27_9TELE